MRWWLPIKYLIIIFVAIGAIEVLVLIIIASVIEKIMQNDAGDG